MIKTIEGNGTGQVIEKKSKFIANAFYVENESEAEELIRKIKKEYYDAKHNCYAYRIIGDSNIIERQSDDGEPARNKWSTDA